MSTDKQEGIVEDGKTFLRMGEDYVRQNDANWQGKRTTYRRCKNCGKLVSRQARVAHDQWNCKLKTRRNQNKMNL